MMYFQTKHEGMEEAFTTVLGDARRTRRTRAETEALAIAVPVIPLNLLNPLTLCSQASKRESIGGGGYCN